MPGQDRIFTAGEKEYEAWLDKKDKGIPINESLRADIIAMRDELKITGYDFPF
jgi:LDH2 family malate/lactate/ureidoglycolate dehydrogenase